MGVMSLSYYPYGFFRPDERHGSFVMKITGIHPSLERHLGYKASRRGFIAPVGRKTHMSHQSHSAPAPAGGLSGNLVAGVILLNLVLFGGILYARTLPPRPESTGGLSVAYVQTQASIPLPTDTPLPSPTPQATAKPRPFSPEVARINAGESIFQTTCSACHGFDAQGISGLGPDMHNNVFINGLSNEALHAFIITGRPADHPDNQSGVAMPARGGNPSLTDNDLTNVIHYLRSLNPDAVVYESGSGDGNPAVVVVQPTATPILATVTPAEFKPLDFNSIGGGSSATATPVP